MGYGRYPTESETGGTLAYSSLSFPTGNQVERQMNPLYVNDTETGPTRKRPTTTQEPTRKTQATTTQEPTKRAEVTTTQEPTKKVKVTTTQEPTRRVEVTTTGKPTTKKVNKT